MNGSIGTEKERTLQATAVYAFGAYLLALWFCRLAAITQPVDPDEARPLLVGTPIIVVLALFALGAFALWQREVERRKSGEKILQDSS